jgi:hypothetical protein
MPLVNMKPLLRDATDNGYAVAGLDVDPRVRVDPLELDHLALQLDRLVAVELRRKRMVGESRAPAR